MLNKNIQSMKTNPCYLVPRATLLYLIQETKVLKALEVGGIESWEWYDDSLDNYLKNYYSNCKDYGELAELLINSYGFEQITIGEAIEE